MSSICKKIILTAASCAAFLPAVVSANTSLDYVTGDSNQTIHMRYNPTTNNFTMDYFENARVDNYDAWWLVVSDGPVPASTGLQLIVDENSDTITAYTYVGKGAQNYQNGQYLATYQFAPVALDEGFTINVAELNSMLNNIDANGTEIGYTEETGAGVWMKGALNAPEFNDDGTIKFWDTKGNNNIFDKKNLPVEVSSRNITTYQPIDVQYAVSEPLAGLALVTAMGLVGLRRRKQEAFA